MTNNFKKLETLIVSCKKCPRLVSFRKKIAKEKRKQFINEKYWGKPITGFGDPKARILFVGLAPAAHGGNRTGRVFTGDRSSDFLYKCLYKAKLSNQPNSDHRNDGLKLKDIFITFEKAKSNQLESQELLYKSSTNDLFCINNLEKDIGYKPKTIFNKFAFDFFNK